MPEEITTAQLNLKKLETHRFQVSELSTDALHEFRNKMAEFISQHPEIQGVTIYGSHVKGTARGELDRNGKSDVDAFIFVNEEAAGLTPIEGRGVNSKEGDVNWEKVQADICTPFKKIYATVAGYPVEQMKDIRVRLLSKARIDTDIQGMAEYTRKMIDFNERQGEFPAFETRPWADIAHIFRLQLGTGLNSYRSYVLSELRKLGAIGDVIWEKFFYDDILSQENNKLMKGIGEEAIAFYEKRKKLFPHTVDDAIAYYKIANVQPRYPTNSKL